VNDIDAERQRFADTLERVGPDAPTNAGDWTAHDVAAHVVSLDAAAGIPVFAGRWIVSRGVRLNDLVRARPQLVQHGFWRVKRRGFAWAVDRLRRPSPRLLLRPSVRTVGLFEVWTHHEDVRRPNGIPRDAQPDLTDVIAWLRRYGDITDAREGSDADVAYWLAGREGGPRPV
jgi:uncharacterized protein (TIGR03083 family)